MSTSAIVTLGLLALFGLALWVSWRENRRHKWTQALTHRIQQTSSPLVCISSYGMRFQVEDVRARRSRWYPYLIAVTPEQIMFYRAVQDQTPFFSFAPDQLRWFGRPKKYHRYRGNELWLHVEKDGRWFLIRLRLYISDMQALIRALKAVATLEQITAYRRQRPYIHFGPAAARPANQDMQGAWSLGDPVTLYLMPLFLVMFNGATVTKTISLETIQGVSAIRRADQARAEGLIRFQAGDQPMAFALKPYDTLAGALGEAARRTLEEPVEVLGRKKKKGDIWADDDDPS
jgi:hypothetical protein